MTEAVRHIVVATREFDSTVHLYRDLLGLSTRHEGSADAGQLTLWGLSPSTETRTVTLGHPDQTHGLLQIVSFGAATGEPVRADARPYDYSPKNLDFQVRDLVGTVDRLKGKGYAFRSEPVFYEHHGHRVGEIQMLGPDNVNVIFLESDMGGPFLFSEQGVAGATQWVLTVADLAGTVKLFDDAFGIPVATRSRLAGPDIEKMVGLPPGAALNIAIVSGRSAYGRIELVHYDGADSKELTARARPPRAGLLQVGFVVDNLNGALDQLRPHQAALVSAPVTATDPLGRTTRAASLTISSGLMIELWEGNP